MQEIMKDGSEGEVHVENTLEDLLPHIKKSLENPDVKYVKVFRGKKLLVGVKMGYERKFTAEEEKRSPLDILVEKCEKGNKKEVEKDDNSKI